MNIKEEISKAILNLQKGNTILYPTDTVWGIGCDATNFDAVATIYSIKQREESKSLIILVDSLEMLSGYVDSIPSKAIDILSSSVKPTTIIYNNPTHLSKNSIASDNTIAIRIVKDNFCKQLIQEFGKPIVSTSANISGEPTPKTFSEITNTILDNVDYIVNLHKDKITTNPSTILKILKNGTIELIRS